FLNAWLMEIVPLKTQLRFGFVLMVAAVAGLMLSHSIALFSAAMFVLASEFGDLKLSSAEVAVITTLLLRGAQTPGELRTRASRMHEFSDMQEVEQTLEGLASREDGPYVVRLAREPGKRESRYMHLFSGDVDVATVTAESDAGSSASNDTLAARVAALEDEVAGLKQRLDALLAHLGD
ncbi:DUF480 domain-containing protein, partial [Enterobacter hormaechei]|nr:DUF480 domain-containing protein [Enterobacter hormaechei]